MNRKTILTAVMAEGNMQELRNKRNFTGEVEKITVKNCIEQAKMTGMRGDKTILVIDPLYVHIPSWQRNLTVARAEEVGKHYMTEKWELPKVYCCNEKFYVADGMHRIYGAFLAGKDAVTMEFMNIAEAKAIDLFLEQTNDRKRMTPADMINAAIAGRRKEWIELQQICHDNGVNIKGDNKSIENPVGTLTTISDGVNMCRCAPGKFDEILKLIKNLQWGDGAYGAKVIRCLSILFAYYGTEKTKNALLLKCKGRDYYETNITTRKRSQAEVFDCLSDIVANTKPAEIVKFKKAQRAKNNKDDLTAALKIAVEN